MTTRTLLGLTLALALVGLVATTSYSDSHTEAKPAAATTPDVLMAQLVGDWTAEGKYFPPGSTEGHPFAGSTKFAMVMEHYLQQDLDLQLTQPFKGRAIFAYDAIEKRWQSTWIDTSQSLVTYYEPTWDDATKTLTGKFESRSPQGAVDVRETLTVNSADKVTLVHYRTARTEGAKEEVELSIVYTRNK